MSQPHVTTHKDTVINVAACAPVLVVAYDNGTVGFVAGLPSDPDGQFCLRVTRDRARQVLEDLAEVLNAEDN
jgi:hypothetical protein